MKTIRMRLSRRIKVSLVLALLVLVSFTFYAFSDKDFKIAKNLDIYVTLFREVSTFYVDETDPEKLIESSIKGMLKDLDPYTTYIPEADVDEFKFMTTGQYGGIGALIRKAGNYTMISEPYEGFPAQKAGLEAGDTLISIDGVSTNGKSISQVSELLKGTPNTKVKLVIKRYGTNESLEKEFEREKVTIKNVPYYGLVTDKIGYIRQGNFTTDASKEVKNALNDLKEQGAESIILDLRGNPGGLLNEAVNISNIWIENGQEIVSTKGKAKRWDKSYVTQNVAEDTSIALTVLVSRGSASASEIVAGSLQDLDRAVVIGQKTFGKGLVQTTRPLSYNAHLKVTTAKYYIPSGRCIQALDYAHRNEDGSVGHIPDSLISEYQTKNGRKVYDGGGIDPDIKVEQKTPGNITLSLFSKNLLFDYATKFAYENDSIAGPESFSISDEIFNDFLAFLNNKEFEYTTQSNGKFKELIKIAKREGYYDKAKEDFEVLEEKLMADKSIDLETFKDEICNLLKEEIVSRYYYQEGRIVSSLQDDEEVKEAIKVLKDGNLMASILEGTYQDENQVALKK